MNVLANVLGYQAVWTAAVLGAGRGLTWPALAAFAAFALWQLALSRERACDLRLMALGIILGIALDGTCALTGLLRYAAPAPAAPHGGAPLWILALWGAFALTVNHSLRWLRDRRLLAMLLGAIGGPLAYIAAEHLAHAVIFAVPRVAALTALAAGWGAALLILMWAATAWSACTDSAVSEAA